MNAIGARDREILRELAKRYLELAALPQQTERFERARDINDLKPRRPVVWLHEIPWHEMDIDSKLRLTCENAFAREMEEFFRQTLYRWEYIQADMVVENAYPLARYYLYDEAEMGIAIQEHQLAIDSANTIVSHAYIDQLDTPEKVAVLTQPQVKADPELDARRKAQAEDIFGDILPVRLHGYYIYHAPWDRIPRFRSVTSVMTDLIDRPELLHDTIKKFTAFGQYRMKQMEALGLLDTNIPELHCTPPYTSDLEPGTGLKNIWFRCMAQMFTEVSPAMWDEFEFEYVKPLMAQCGLVYYGCCEALERKIRFLKTIPNLRKIGVPPRANVESCAEQIGGDYVYAHKPNPAHVAGNFDADIVRNEISRVIEACRANNTPYEFVLKDISTCSYKPENMIKWTQTVMNTIDKYHR